MPARLTATSYALLGLLAVRPWSTYELVQQVRRGWADVWPRTERAIYQEPARLVSAGYATARTERTGARSRTVYSITDEGRAALRHWLEQSSEDPRLEAEALLKVVFADQGTRADLLRAVREVRDYAQRRSATLLAQGEEYLASGGPFPERLHVLYLVGGFLAEQHAAMIRWADWAEARVTEWEAADSARAVPDVDRRVREVAARFRRNAQPPGR